MQVARAAAHEPARPSLREERSSGRRSRGVASANASRDRNHRITFRGSHPWNQRKICLRRRLGRQYILHLFAYNDVVVSRTRAYGVPCNSICKDQTNLTFPRAYRASLRRDIKDRCISGALSIRPQGADSLSDRCLDTCCFLARQLHVARKPWMIASSSSNNIWSYPLVLQLATLPNTWAMTSDLCGYGDKWRIRTGLLMGWIDSRDRHRFAKHCLTPKGGISSFPHLFALPTRPVFHIPCTVCGRFGFRALHQCQRPALLQTDTGFWFGRCGVARSLFLQSRTARTKVSTSRAILLLPVPSKLFTTVVVFFCLAQQNEFLAPSLTHAECVQHDTRTRFLTTSHRTFIYMESQLASRSFAFSITLSDLSCSHR